MKLFSVNRTKVGNLFVEQSGHTQRIVTGIHKRPVEGPIVVNKLGLQDDEQADLTVHGGLEKAVYAYPHEHYAFWKTQCLARFKLDKLLAPGALGENLTTQGILENDVWIDDRLLIGSVVLVVTEPRQPCFKLNAKMGFNQAAKLMTQSGATGFYLKVFQEGILQVNNDIQLIAGPREVSLVKINEQRRKGRQQDLF